MSFRFDLVTLFPGLVADYSQYGVLSRALRDGIITLQGWNPRNFSDDRNQRVDDSSYGGGPGMVMKAEPIARTLQAIRDDSAGVRPVIYLSPQGRRVDHDLVKSAAAGEGLILLAGRYEGIDERLIDEQVDEEWSIGDFVVNGGELPALMIVEAVTRLLPGALGDVESAQQDSFSDGLLDYPHYTRPAMYGEREVPAVLMSGDHQKIKRWRMKQALGRTWSRRPDLLAKRTLSIAEQQLLDEYIEEQRQKGSDVGHDGSN